MRLAGKLLGLGAAMIATLAMSGVASARSRHHAVHAHGPVRHYVDPDDEPYAAYGAASRYDDRVYGGAYYGFFTSPSYGRFQSY